MQFYLYNYNYILCTDLRSDFMLDPDHCTDRKTTHVKPNVGKKTSVIPNHNSGRQENSLSWEKKYYRLGIL